MIWLVGILSYGLVLLVLPLFLFHPRLRQGFKERLSLYPPYWPHLQDDGTPRVWIHGASAGDVLALIPLARQLKQTLGNVQIIGSTVTNSGRMVTEKEKAVFDAYTYLPLDLPGVVHRALRHIRPQVLVLEYTELWPQLISAAHAQGVKVVLHNGRFSAQRLGRYRLLFRFTGNLLQRMAMLLVRDEQEAEHARLLGAPEAIIRVTGNTKFDNLQVDFPTGPIDALRQAFALDDNAQVLVAGSTHDPEEDILLRGLQKLHKEHPKLQLLLAPRYLERVDKVVQIIERHGFKARRRSESQGQTNDDPNTVMVLDTMGELSAAYALGTIDFVGGSFMERGGHNILEPAATARPVLFGPRMENTADAVQVLLGRGGIQLATAEQLYKVVDDLLKSPERCHHLGQTARETVLRERGAAQRNANAIAELLRGS